MALNPDGLFEADLFDMNPEVMIDLMGVTGIDDAPMRIRIDVVLALTGQERMMIIQDFIRPQLGNGIWTMNGDPSVDLDVKLTTSAFSGLYRVMKEDLPADMTVTHYRVGLAEVVTIEMDGLSDNDKFEVEYAVAGSALFSPFVTLLSTILLLVSGIIMGLRLTQNRSRWIIEEFNEISSFS